MIIKGSLLMSLPIIKRFWRNAHAPCNVIQGRGVTNNHIFEIRDPIAYSLYNFQGAAVIIKRSLLMSLPIIKGFWRIAHAPVSRDPR